MGAHRLPGVAEGGGSGASWGALGATIMPLCAKAAAGSSLPTAACDVASWPGLPRCHFCNSNKNNLNNKEAAEREPRTGSWLHWEHSGWSPRGSLCVQGGGVAATLTAGICAPQAPWMGCDPRGMSAERGGQPGCILQPPCATSAKTCKVLLPTPQPTSVGSPKAVTPIPAPPQGGASACQSLPPPHRHPSPAPTWGNHQYTGGCRR